MIKQNKLIYIGSRGWQLHHYRSIFGIKFAHTYKKVIAKAKALLDDGGNNIKDDYDYVHQRNQLRDAISELERNK